MSNEILLVIEVFLTFGILLLAYRLFGKLGLFIWIPIATILANIQVLVSVSIFGLVGTLGNVIYSSNFLATDIISEKYGKKDATRAVAIGFFALIATTVLMNFSLLYTPLGDALSKESYNHVKSIFSVMPRLAFASLLAFLVSQTHDIWAFEIWKRKFAGKKYLWIRNNASTIVSQIIDNGIFTVVAFWGTMPKENILQIFITTFIFKTILSIADTPFVYLATAMHTKKDSKTQKKMELENA